MCLGLFLRGFSTKTQWAFLIFPLSATCSTRFILFIWLSTIFGNKCKSLIPYAIFSILVTQCDLIDIQSDVGH